MLIDVASRSQVLATLTS